MRKLKACAKQPPPSALFSFTTCLNFIKESYVQPVLVPRPCHSEEQRGRFWRKECPQHHHHHSMRSKLSTREIAQPTARVIVKSFSNCIIKCRILLELMLQPSSQDEIVKTNLVAKVMVIMASLHPATIAYKEASMANHQYLLSIPMPSI